MHPPVIAIGSSAGGVAALHTLVHELPSQFAGALLIVNHLSPVHESHLSDLLAKVTALPVRQALDGDQVRSGEIYIAPPDHHLMLEAGRIRVTHAPKENRNRPSVDALFRSCSLALGRSAIGAVLTGTLDDGSAGLWMIKDRGGTTITQDPAEAQHDSMPRSAIKQVQIDHIVSLAEMSALFGRLIARNATRTDLGR